MASWGQNQWGQQAAGFDANAYGQQLGQQQQQYGQQAQVGMQAYTQQAQLQQQQALGQQQMGMDQYGQQTGYGHQQAASNMAYGQQAQQSSFTQAGQQQGSAQASTAVPGFRDPYAASAGQQTVAAATPATGGSTIQFDQYGQPYTVTKDTFTAPSANPYAAYAQQQQQQQQQQQEAQRKAMLEQQQKQLEAQREAQRQDQLKKQQEDESERQLAYWHQQQELLRQQREAAPAATTATTSTIASMMQMYQQAASAYAQPQAGAYTAAAAAAAGGIGVAQQELLRQQQAKLTAQLQMQQMQAMKNAAALAASQVAASHAAAKPPEPGHMARFGAAASTGARPLPGARDSRDARGPPGASARPGLGADREIRRRDDRPLERRLDDRRPDRPRSPRSGPMDGDRRDSGRGRYLVKVSPFPYTTVERDYQQLRLRYPKLHVATDFQKATCVWPDAIASGNMLEYPLDNQVSYWTGDKKNPSMLRRLTKEALPKSQTTAPTKFNAKVMLMQGLPKDWLNMLEETHMSKLIRFMCVKNSKYGLMCMGGMWQKDLDGGQEGAPDENALVQTAIRCVKDTVDLDLSKVEKWHRFLEITYHRPSETYKGNFYPEQTEITVIFVPELDGVMPDEAAFNARVGELKADLDAQALAEWEATMQKRADKKREIEEKKAKAAAAAAEAKKLKAAAEEAAKQAAIAAAAAAGKDRPASPPGEPEDEVKPEPDKTEESPEKEDPDPPKPEPVVLEDLPKAPALIPRPRWDEGGDTKAQFKCVLLSLDGLLDYNLDDDLEKNFEVSLFAELFQEMLQSKFAQVIRKSLEATAVEEEKLKLERDAEREASEKKRQEERDKEKKDDGASGKRTGEEVEEGAAKKAKTEMSGFVKAEGETLNANGDESVSGGAVSTGLAEALKVLHEPCGDEEFVLVETEKEVDQTEVFHLEKVLHAQLHPAWLYFDKGYAEYLRADDVEVMLHNLGVFLSAKQVEQLVSWSSSGRRISYRKWSVSHKPVFDGTKPYALPKEEEADKMDDTNAPPTSPAKGGGDAAMQELKAE